MKVNATCSENAEHHPKPCWGNWLFPQHFNIFDMNKHKDIVLSDTTVFAGLGAAEQAQPVRIAGSGGPFLQRSSLQFVGCIKLIASQNPRIGWREHLQEPNIFKLFKGYILKHPFLMFPSRVFPWINPLYPLNDPLHFVNKLAFCSQLDWQGRDPESFLNGRDDDDDRRNGPGDERNMERCHGTVSF